MAKDIGVLDIQEVFDLPSWKLEGWKRFYIREAQDLEAVSTKREHQQRSADLAERAKGKRG